MSEDGFQRALESLQRGGCVAILDAESREAETDLFFPAQGLTPENLRTLRTQAGGELYIAIGQEVASAFDLPFIGEVLGSHELHKSFPVLEQMGKEKLKMCQGSCSVGLSLDHRSLKTGAPDSERSFTCRRLAEIYEEVNSRGLGVEESSGLFGDEFHTPGHIFMCVENSRGLRARSGHTELSVALARSAGILPVMVGCVMLNNQGDNFGALDSESARLWTSKHDVPFLTGQKIVDEVMVDAMSNGHT